MLPPHLALEIARVPDLAHQLAKALHQLRLAPRVVRGHQEEVAQRGHARQDLQRARAVRAPQPPERFCGAVALGLREPPPVFL
jgi:hypothetical protein